MTYLRFGSLLLLAGVVVAVVWFAWGCATVNYAADLAARQQAVQDCILSGKHPRLGLGGSIYCE